MAIDANKVNPNSQKLEESLSKLLDSDLPLPDSDKNNVRSKLKIDMSQTDIKTRGGVKGGEVEGIKEGEVDARQTTIDSDKDVEGPKFKIG